ncbi:hypothetical protein DEO72_LG2g4407 [Vigna unguiculata]|uniref:Uncharacterized protein n=1 Tax=Vigna unguiculata TaxID=3917 RepID=A0A4D6L6A8_VIGUN|nr:hypothetical protein DEO72_LG2g4407 [Vigna unguiculata]
MCDPDCDCHHDYEDSSDEEEEEDDDKPGGGTCKPSPPPYDRSPPADRPWIGLHQQNLPDPFWKQRRCLEILGRYPSPPRIPVPCMMFTETNYESEFPSLERQVDPVSNIATKPNISPTEIGPEGRLKPLTQAEEVLNWHTENAKAQNNILKRIDAGVSRLSTHIEETDGRILHLSERMQKHYHHLSLEISRLEKEWKTTSFGKASDEKEREIRSLKSQIQELDDLIAKKEKQLYHPDPYAFMNPFRIVIRKKNKEIPSLTFSWPTPRPRGKNLSMNLQKKKKSTAAVLGALHEEFIGDGAITDRKIRQEFFEMKCCSLNMKDLDRHFKRMIQRFYLLNGGNDPSLKNTYVASLPVDLQPELNRMAIAAQKDFSHMTMGQIHQMTKEAVDKLCRQHQHFSDILNQRRIGWDICEPTLWAIWCKSVQRSIPLALKVQETYNILTDPSKQDYLFWTLLEWFSPIPWWRHELEKIIHYQRQRNVDISKSTSIIIIHRPYFQNHSGAIWSKNKAYIWGTFDEYPIPDSYRQQLVRHLKEIPQEENHNEIQLTPSRMIPSGQQGPTNTEFYIPEGRFQISQDLGGPEEDKEDFDSWNPAGQEDDIMDSDTDPNLSPSHEPIFKD